MTRKSMVLLVAIFMFLGLLIVPAAGHHKDGHDGGPPAEQGGGNGGGDGNDQGSGGDTQGNSESNPDGGGVDKPYPADGQPAGSQGAPYHDGNNGCGQDKRSGEPRETGTERPGWDDNNGWCGKPKSDTDSDAGATGTGETVVVIPESNVVSAGVSSASFEQPRDAVRASGDPTTVLAAQLGGSQRRSMSSTLPQETSVLGIKLVRGQPLAMTGAPLVALATTSAALLLVGYVLVSKGRRGRVGA